MRAAEEAAVRTYAESLITPIGPRTCCGLEGPEVRLSHRIGFLHSAGSSILFEDRAVVTTANLQRKAFEAEWIAHCQPLQLAPPVTAGTPLSSGRSWPLPLWVNYIESRPALHNTIDWSRPLIFIVRDDVYPCTGGSWSHLGVALANHGPHARQPAYY